MSNNEVAILGVGMHPWGKWGRNFVEYGVHAIQAALEDAELDWRKVAQGVMRSRALDDLEERALAPSGEVPYQFSARGHELAQVLLAAILALEACPAKEDVARGLHRALSFDHALPFVLIGTGLQELGEH